MHKLSVPDVETAMNTIKIRLFINKIFPGVINLWLKETRPKHQFRQHEYLRCSYIPAIGGGGPPRCILRASP